MPSRSTWTRNVLRESSGQIPKLGVLDVTLLQTPSIRAGEKLAEGNILTGQKNSARPTSITHDSDRDSDSCQRARRYDSHHGKRSCSIGGFRSIGN